MDNNSLAHSRYNCTYHIVFIPKYRRKVMFGELRKDVGEILGKVCRMEGVTIIKAATLPDHVHMYVSIPPKLSVSKAVGLIKGKSALMIFDRHPEYREKGNRHFWVRGYYCETVGNVNEETIKSIFRSSTKGIGWSIKRKPLLSGLPVKKERFARPPLGGNAKVLPQGGYPIPPAELVVGPFGGEWIKNIYGIKTISFVSDQYIVYFNLYDFIFTDIQRSRRRGWIKGRYVFLHGL